jgi:ribosomal protein S1
LFNGPSRREDAQLQHGQVAKLIVVGRVRGVDGTAILVMLPRTVAIASNLKITSDSLSSTAKANKQRRKRDRANSEVDTLMLVGSDEVKAKQSQAKQQKAKDLQPGSLVDVRIKRIFRREMLVQAVRVQGIALGTVHITDVVDTPELLKLAKQSTKAQAERQQIKGTRLTDNEDHSLFSRFEVGGYARACVVAVLDNERDKSGARKNHKKKKARRTSNSDNKDDEGEDDEGEDDEEESQKEEVFRFAFSLRPSETSEAKKQDDNPVTQDFLQERTTWSNVMSKYNTSNGQAVKLVGFVTDIKSEFAQVEFSRGVSGSIDIVDTISQSFLPEGIMPPSRAINKKKKARKGKVLQTDGENNVISDSQMELGLISNRHELSQLSLASKFKIGQAITVRIISSDSKKHHLRCSTILNDENACTYAPGAVVICRVREIVRATIDQALRVQMPNNCVGRICVSDVRAKHDWIDDQLGKLIHQLRSIDVTGKSISVNSNLLVQDTSSKPVNNCRGVRLVRARVVSVCRKEGAKDNTYDLALFRTSSSLPSGEVAKATTPSTGEHKKRKSEAISIGQSNESVVLSASNSTSDAIVEGALLTGFVANASARGVFVRVSRSLTARVFPRNLADHFIKNVSDEFPRGKLVAGRVITVRTSSVKGKRQKSKNKSPKSANLRVELTLKPSEVAGNLDEDVEEWEKLAVGSIVEGRVKSMKDFGIFIRIDGTEIDGLAHRTQCADEIQHQKGNLSDLFTLGDVVRCKITKVNAKRKRLSVSLKPSVVFTDRTVTEQIQVNQDIATEETAAPSVSKESDHSNTRRSKSDNKKDEREGSESDDASDSDGESETNHGSDTDTRGMTSANKVQQDQTANSSSNTSMFMDLWGDEFAIGSRKTKIINNSDDESDSDSSSDQQIGTGTGKRSRSRKATEQEIRRKEMQVCSFMQLGILLNAIRF